MEPATAVPGTDLTYRVAGAGADLVLVHGLGGLFHSWSALMPRLAATHRVWELGLPDFDSATTLARGGNSVEAYRGDLAGFLERLGIERPILVGNSLGGQVAAAFAAEAPKRVPALVLLGASGVGEERDDAQTLFAGAAVRRLVRTLDDETMRAILRTVFSHDASYEGELAEIRERASNRSWKRGLLATARKVKGASIVPLLARLACPTLMLYGAEDRIVPLERAREAARSLPRGEMLVIEGSGHAPQIERPEETHRAIDGFLRGALG